MSFERIRLYEEIRHTEAVLHGKRFISLITVFAVSLLLIGSTFVVAAIFLFGQNIPASTVGINVVGCNNPSTTTENLIVDTVRGGTGVTFVCPDNPTFGHQSYAIQPLGPGSAHWDHSGGIGGFDKLYLILSYAIPTQGCHAGISSIDHSLIDPAWFLDMTTPTGTFTFFDSQHAYAYCGEYTALGNFGPIFVSWTQ